MAQATQQTPTSMRRYSVQVFTWELYETWLTADNEDAAKEQAQNLWDSDWPNPKIFTLKACGTDHIEVDEQREVAA